MLTDMPTELLIATFNTGKMRELTSLLSGIPFSLRSLNSLSGVREIEETGTTISENAELKAAGYARQTGLWALADDTGIEIDALGGAPGVYSDRFAGEGASDAEKVQKVLTELASLPDTTRVAKFVCVMALSDPTGKIIFNAEDACTGWIAFGPRGFNGFGYDSIFVPDGFDRTFGELDPDIKQQISHRARASAKIIRYLQGFFGVSLDQRRFRL